MKTQMTFVQGNAHQRGTNYADRRREMSKIIEENPQCINLLLKDLGEVVELKRHDSHSGKTTWYKAEIAPATASALGVFTDYDYEQRHVLTIDATGWLYVFSSARKNADCQWEGRRNTDIEASRVEIL